MQNLLFNNLSINYIFIHCFINDYKEINKNNNEYKEFFKFIYSLTLQKPLFTGYKLNKDKLSLFKITLFNKNKINNFLSFLFIDVLKYNFDKNLKNIKFFKFNKFLDFNIFINNNKLNFFSDKYNLKCDINFRNIYFNIILKFNKSINNKFKLYYLIKNNFKIKKL
uniref:Ribosomal protein L5 n=1 Tax=Babesia rodhaini TaxID=5870 RepID=A0A455QY75_BABRO|nr:hypothetical protein [Babesia rodhaini]